MKIEEKRIKYNLFIENKFTLSSWNALHLFQRNTQEMAKLIGWEVDEATTILEKSTNSWSPEDHYKIEFIHHDIISKLLMMIEGLCVVIITLSKNKTKLTHKLSYYKSNPVIDLEEKLENSKDKEKITLKLLCLPNLNSIRSIDSHERNFLKKVFSQTCKHWYNVLRGLIKFHLHNSILYNKFKHGLLILPGLKLEKNAFPISTALTITEKPSLNIKNLIETNYDFFPKEYSLFNTVSLMSLEKKFIRYYVKIASRTTELTDYIANNNYLYAENCGQDYLPSIVTKDGKLEPKFYYSRLSTPEENQEIERKIHMIYEKARNNINFSSKGITRFQFKLRDQDMKKMVNLIEYYGAASIRYSKDDN